MSAAADWTGSLGFSLVAGGPYHRLERALRLVRDDARDVVRQSLAAVGITWGPVAFLTIAEGYITGRPSRLLVDLSVDLRFLIVLPLLFVAERSLHIRTQRCIDRFHSGRFAGPDEAMLPRLVAGTARLRDALLPELVLASLALASGVVVMAGGTGRTALFTGSIGTLPESAARLWHGLVAFPLYLFLNARAVWRWLLWCYLLHRLSRLRVEPMASHPDRQGGLSFLAEPSVGFAPVLSGLAVVTAANWGHLMITQGVSAKGFVPQGALLVILALVVALGPLMMFAGHLYRARFLAVRQYWALALDYSRAFHRRWIGPRDPEQLLGTPDIQSLADLASAHDVVCAMRVVPFGGRSVVLIAVATMVPMVPLLLAEVPLSEIASRLIRLLIAGAPG